MLSGMMENVSFFMMDRKLLFGNTAMIRESSGGDIMLKLVKKGRINNRYINGMAVDGFEQARQVILFQSLNRRPFGQDIMPSRSSEPFSTSFL